jgi:glycosyltransferase involved in cell wall biosynthesis
MVRANRTDGAGAVGQLDGELPRPPEMPSAPPSAIGRLRLAAAAPADGKPANAPSPASPVGVLRFHIDEVSESRIGGWVIRSDEPSHRCLIAVKEGDRVIARTVASQFRADLAQAGIGDGFHAFSVATPRSLLDGAEHLIEIIEQDSGVALTATPIRWRSERVAPVAMPNRLEAAQLLGLAPLAPPEVDRPDLMTRADSGGRRGLAETAPATTSRAARAPAITGTRILFDISDLVYYIGHHANLTGIQRVQSSIVLAILRNNLVPQSNLTFLSFNPKTRTWMSIPSGFLSSLLEDLFLPETQRPVSFPAEEAQYGVLPGARVFTGSGVLDDGNPSVLCLLGAAWVQQEYIERVLFMKRQFGTRFVMTVHDLIPVYARETCDQDTARVFEEFMRRALRHTDHILSVSENTARDVRRYTQVLKIPEPAITVTRNGSSFAEFLPEDGGGVGDLGPSDVPERFVLFVATIEGRKNHQLMFDIWRRMIEAGEDPPHLVCVGRLGWKSTSFISALVETDNLDGRILLLRDISDTDLRMLYSRCLFSVCPTFYEGWGLPVGESLAMGKICVSSDRASVPEVAGEFGVYIDINDFDQSLATIREMISDRAKRRRLEAKIRRGYKPVTWLSVAEKVVEACLAAPKTKWQDPYPDVAIPYASEISFGRLDRDMDGTGELLLTRIAGARRGAFTNEPLDDRAFIRGEEAHSGGNWDYPESWGTWTCYSGGELTVALPPNDSVFYYVILRLRVSGPITDHPIQISANGDSVWQGSIGPGPRNLGLRIRRRVAGADGWRLRLRAQTSLTAELERRIAEDDSRVPTIGFERLIVVPENDLKARLDIIYRLLL